MVGMDHDWGIRAEDVKKEIERLSNQPKILFIGGTHPRHLYYANKIHERYPLAGAVFENRGGLMPKYPTGISPTNFLHFHTHFENRIIAERKYFGEQKAPEPQGFCAHTANPNNKSIIRSVKHLNPDIALIFGCGMIKGELAKALPELTINLHLGLSPRYRGAATLFWPFYFLEPQWAGCTFHKIVDEPDAGDILHQCVPELERGDKIHDVACKAVVKATEDMIELLYRLILLERDWQVVVRAGLPADRYDWIFHPQSTTGKNFLSRDFQPSHLRMIYETYNDDIVDQYLDGNLKQHKPKLVRQF